MFFLDQRDSLPAPILQLFAAATWAINLKNYYLAVQKLHL